jgi:hypothetical protein
MEARADRFTPLNEGEIDKDVSIAQVCAVSVEACTQPTSYDSIAVGTKRPLDSPDLRINPRPLKKTRFYNNEPISSSLNSPHQCFAEIKDADEFICSKSDKSKAANISSRNGNRHDDPLPILTAKTPQIHVNGTKTYDDLLALLRVPANQGSLQISITSLLHVTENIPPANAVLFDPRQRYLGKRFTCCKRENVA